MANGYAVAWDSLAETIGAAQGYSSGSITDLEGLTTDQRLEVAKIAAILALVEEVSALNPQNVTTHSKDGTKRNGWGFPIHD